ncbi:MAG: ABC transporter ATP-binding protein/permease [Actinomycetota bacterium]|nr:ABC transporter ATP-binding protein/permease [Actinomycetota bacterium]
MSSSATISAADVPLIGVEDLTPPHWSRIDELVAGAGFWKTLAAIPGAIGSVTRLAWATAPRLTVIVAVVQVVAGCVTAFGLFATANVLTELLGAGPTPERVVASLPAIAAVVGAFAARGLLQTAVGMAQGALTPRMRQAAQDDLNVAVAGVDLAAFDDADFRELILQCSRHGVRSLETATRLVSDVAASLISMVAAMVTAGFLNPWLAPVLTLAAVADAWAAMRVAKRSYLSYLRMVTRNMRLGVVERLLTSRDVAVERHALTLQDTLVGEHRRIAHGLTAEAVRLEFQKNRIRLAGRTLAGFGTGIAYFVLGFLLYTQAMPLAIAGAAVIAMRTASTALSTTMHSVNMLYEQSFYIALYRQLLDDARERHHKPTGVEAPPDPELIQLDAVSFTYPGADHAALTDINLRIRRGEVIALVGQNGSGKTTLGKLITGLYRPTDGTVTWDGIDIALADPRRLHTAVSVISQEPARWPMTAGRNIRVGRLDSDDPERWRAALSESGADDVLRALPSGEDTVLSKDFKDGQDLSGGQWQRISVARGIYRDAAVLVADEPTAALDAKAEATVFAGLRHATRSSHGDGKNRTTILVTHRLANIRYADRIIVLDQGRLAEQGTHPELIALNGIYRELYDIQASAYRDDPQAATG